MTWEDYMGWAKQDNETPVNMIMDEEFRQWVMGNVVCEGMTIVWCGVPSGGSQGKSSWRCYTPNQYIMHMFSKCIQSIYKGRHWIVVTRLCIRFKVKSYLIKQYQTGINAARVSGGLSCWFLPTWLSILCATVVAPSSISASFRGRMRRATLNQCTSIIEKRIFK